jgi:regulator of sigma E protease
MNTVFSIAFTIFVIVLIHETGHFIFARIFGVTVERFAIGFPPLLFRKKIGGTEYSLGLIPLGGYVKMKGILDESMDGSSITGAPDEFMSKNPVQKILILSGGVIFNLIFAFLIFSVITFSNGKTVFPGTTVGIVDSSSIGFQAGLRINDRIITINGKKVRNWDDISNTFLKYLGNNITVEILRNGEQKQIFIPADYFKQKNSEYLGVGPKLEPVIGDVQNGSPAEKGGLKPGDKILAFNGSVIETWYQLTDSIRKYPDKQIELTVLRGTDTLLLSLVPRSVMVEQKDAPAKEIGQLGVTVRLEKIEFGFVESLKQGILEVENQFIMNFKGFYMLISGKRSPREMIGGPIIIAKMASTAASFGFATLFKFIASLNIILAIFNILPIPALDGGHILIVLIETVRRKQISLQTRMRIQQIGFAILMLLVLFSIFNDLTR